MADLETENGAGRKRRMATVSGVRNRPSPDEERRPSQIDSASREALQFPESVGIRALNGGTHISVIA